MKLQKLHIVIVLFLSLAIQLSLPGQNHSIDSLQTLIKKDKQDTTSVKHLISLSNTYKFINEYDSAFRYINQAMVLSKKLIVGKEIGWKKGIGLCYNNMGLISWRMGNYAAALKNYFIAEKLFKEINSLNNLAYAYNNIGLIYDEQGNYTDALKNYYASLKIMERIKSKSGISMCYNNIGLSYHWMGNDSSSLKNFYTALKLSKELNLKEDISLAYNNIGLVYDNQGKYPEALNNYFAALKITEEINDRDGAAMNYNNIGVVYSRQNLFPEALKMYLISLKIKEEIRDKKGIISSYINLGDFYIETHRPKEAEPYLKKALSLSIETGRKGDIMKSYKSLITLDTINGNHKDAYKHLKLYKIYSDSLYSEENRKKGIETAMQYEFDKKEETTKFKTNKIVSDLENQNKLQNQKQFFLIIFITVFITLVLVMLFFAKRAYDSKKKYSEVLSKENDHKELLLREVHHRVNNSLQMISSLLSIQADTAGNEEIREYLLKSENRIHAMSTMHHLLHMGNSKLEVNINQYLGEIINFYSKVLEAKPNIKLHIEIPFVNFHTKTALPLALLLNELLTNSIKYAFPGDDGKINISLTSIKDTNQWILIVKDNGIGFKDGDVGDKGTRLGLNLVKLMARQIGGTLETNHENGTSFELTFNIMLS